MTLQNRSNARGKTAISAGDALHMRVRSVAAAVLLTLLPAAAHAAGFDCAKAASSTEKTICADAALSKLDGDLAAAWKQALAKGGDTAALKAAQVKWLKQRDRCGADESCLGDRYRERLASLNGRPLAADRWQQTWYMKSANPSFGGVLTFTGTAPRLHFELAGNNGANTGGLDGDIVLHGDVGTYRKDKCRLEFERKGGRVGITQDGADSDCGAGMGVFYGGEYLTASQFQAAPAADLLSLEVVGDSTQNATAHKLLGADYQTLVDTANYSTDEKDLDGLNAHVTSYWVRGIATTNAAIVMRRGNDLWIGLLVFDAQSNVRMRYYSNVPAWKKTVPKTIQAWHDRLDKTLPVDVMQ
ncbi:Lysozyme inhibitor LprI [Burkholderia cepacia]|nr:Lysozyme inhibitor LprI [Burkholderia cepacia]